MSKKCIVCGREIENGKNREEHHISYPVKGFPEVKVVLHKKCHLIVHNTDHYEGLKPRKGHSGIYYNNDEREAENLIDERSEKNTELSDSIQWKENLTKREAIGDVLGEIVLEDEQRYTELGFDELMRIKREVEHPEDVDIIEELEKRPAIRKVDQDLYVYDKTKMAEQITDMAISEEVGSCE